MPAIASSPESRLTRLTTQDTSHALLNAIRVTTRHDWGTVSCDRIPCASNHWRSPPSFAGPLNSLKNVSLAVRPERVEGPVDGCFDTLSTNGNSERNSPVRPLRHKWPHRWSWRTYQAISSALSQSVFEDLLPHENGARDGEPIEFSLRCPSRLLLWSSSTKVFLQYGPLLSAHRMCDKWLLA